MTHPTPEPAPSHDELIERITDLLVLYPAMMADLGECLRRAAPRIAKAQRGIT